MPFFTYDDTNRSQFDLTTQKQINRLAQRFGRVELKEVTESSEWCIRVTVNHKDEQFPLAALGDTPYDAALRLSRMVDPGTDESKA